MWAWRALALTGALIAAVGPAIDKVRRDRRQTSFEDELVKVKADQVVAINDALDPLVEKLGELVSIPPENREAALGALITQALASASRVIGPDRARACFFEADGVSNPRRLVPRHFDGRSGKPRTTFIQGQPDGDFVIGLLEHDQHYFCNDVLASPPPGWDASRTRGYRTFISVPASAGADALGLLTLDAPEPGDLALDDVPLLRVIGSVIATGIKIGRASV